MGADRGLATWHLRVGPCPELRNMQPVTPPSPSPAGPAGWLQRHTAGRRACPSGEGQHAPPSPRLTKSKGKRHPRGPQRLPVAATGTACSNAQLNWT